MDLQQFFNKRQSRRKVLRQFGVLAGMSLTFDACSGNSPSPPLDLIHHVGALSNHIVF